MPQGNINWNHRRCASVKHGKRNRHNPNKIAASRKLKLKGRSTNWLFLRKIDSSSIDIQCWFSVLIKYLLYRDGLFDTNPRKFTMNRRLWLLSGCLWADDCYAGNKYFRYWERILSFIGWILNEKAHWLTVFS